MDSGRDFVPDVMHLHDLCHFDSRDGEASLAEVALGLEVRLASLANDVVFDDFEADLGACDVLDVVGPAQVVDVGVDAFHGDTLVLGSSQGGVDDAVRKRREVTVQIRHGVTNSDERREEKDNLGKNRRGDTIIATRNGLTRLFIAAASWKSLDELSPRNRPCV